MKAIVNMGFKMEKSEKVIIDLLCDDVQKGMALLIDAYGGAVKSICGHILKSCNSDLIEDSVQDTFVNIWESVSNKKAKIDNLKSYVYQCARNQAINDLKKYKKDKGLSLEELQYTGIEELISTSRTVTEQQVAVEDGYKQIHIELESIAEPDKTIFVLRYFYNYTVKEIALHYKLKEDNVESKLRRCKSKLKKKLLERGVFYE